MPPNFSLAPGEKALPLVHQENPQALDERLPEFSQTHLWGGKSILAQASLAVHQVDY